MQVAQPSSSNNAILWSGTVMDIPMDPTTSPQYVILFDDGTIKSVPASKMASLIPKPAKPTSNSYHLLPPFLQLNSKITYGHEGQFHKGYLTKTPDGLYCFSYKSHVNKNFPTGVFSCQTSPPPGMSCAPVASSFRATIRAASSETTPPGLLV